ncbi:MAG: hypothetical protein PVF51_08790 [Nitrospirota bacterium]|jgi:hypothetical protein
MSQINVRFEQAADHRTFHASGVWGGHTPQGDVIASFFFEHQALPQGLVVELDETGGPATTERLGGSEFVREVVTSVVMSPPVALSVGKWLIERARRAGARDPEEEA